MELAFYTLGLQQFKELDFIAANFSTEVFLRYEEILLHEQTHVEILTAALGNQATQACNYTLCVFFF
jgi:Ferritin-like domain